VVRWLISSHALQANAGDFIYIFYGTMDKPGELPPKGEFFCKYRDGWMPEIPGLYILLARFNLVINPVTIPAQPWGLPLQGTPELPGRID
jgi:hypothetical protein